MVHRIECVCHEDGCNAHDCDLCTCAALGAQALLD